MEVCAEADMDVGVTVEKLNAGVAFGCVVWGEVRMEGVEACSVANRSGVGVEAAGMLHPAVSVQMSNVKMNFVLFMFGLNGFKVALLACQNFGTNTSAIRAGYLFICRMIFLEASHALHFGRYKTNVQLRMFHRRTDAEFVPMGLQGGGVKFGDFAEGDVKDCDTLPIRTAKNFLENCLNMLGNLH